MGVMSAVKPTAPSWKRRIVFFECFFPAGELFFFFHFFFRSLFPSPPSSPNPPPHLQQRRGKVEPRQRALRARVRLGQHARRVVEEGRAGGEHRALDLGQRGKDAARGGVDRVACVGRQDRVLQVEAREELLAIGDLAEVAVRREHDALEHFRGLLEVALFFQEDLREDRGPVAVVLRELVGEVL